MESEKIKLLEMRNIITEIRNCFKYHVRLVEERICELQGRVIVINKS